MFNFFKRSDKASNDAPAGPSRSAKKARSSSGGDLLEPLPVPEVQEGNLDSDWAMWEDSVLEQETHPPTQYAKTIPSNLDYEPDLKKDPDSNLDADSDPFGNVTKNRP